VTVPAGRFLVAVVEWDESGEGRQETYGPWAASEDDSHLAAIGEFVRAWPERAGVLPKTVTLTLCLDPLAFLSGEAVTAAGSGSPALRGP